MVCSTRTHRSLCVLSIRRFLYLPIRKDYVRKYTSCLICRTTSICIDHCVQKTYQTFGILGLGIRGQRVHLFGLVPKRRVLGLCIYRSRFYSCVTFLILFQMPSCDLYGLSQLVWLFLGRCLFGAFPLPYA